VVVIRRWRLPALLIFVADRIGRIRGAFIAKAPKDKRVGELEDQSSTYDLTEAFEHRCSPRRPSIHLVDAESAHRPRTATSRAIHSPHGVNTAMIGPPA
jgi:hypothetical protein